MSPNKQLVSDFFEEFFNRHNLQSAYTYLREDYIQHSFEVHGSGPDALVAHFAKVFEAMPKFSVEIKRLVEEGDIVVLHGHGRTDPGKIEVSVVDILRIQDGKLAEHWETIRPIPPDRLADAEYFF